MKLFMFPIAPNPTKVRLYLAEKRAAGCAIDVEEVVVNLAESEQRAPEFLERNPFGVLPVLEMDNGEHITESDTIIEYLEERFPAPSMYGIDAESRAIGRQLQRIADIGVLISVGNIVHATNSPSAIGRPPNPHIAAHFREKLIPRLDYFEKLLSDGRSFLAGESVTVADCTVAAALQFGRFREMEFLSDHARLQRWDAAYRSRDIVSGIIIG